jgi:uncharacterized membrane protein
MAAIVHYLEAAAMSLIPDWAPNIHPLLVHFPISLLIAATVVDLLSLMWPARRAIRDTATWFYCAGAFMAMAAYFSGLAAAGALRVSPETGAAVTSHFMWADRTTWFFVVFASFRMTLSYIWKSATRWLALLSLIGALVGLGLLLAATTHGERLVFRFGLGVASVPSTGQPWSMPERTLK